jgi:multiple sugar transport system ATP-binding protein
VVYVTQDYKEAMALGDRIAVMAAGRIRQLGTPEEIYNQPADMEIARLFGDPTINLLDITPQKDAAGIFVDISNVRLPLPHAPASVVGQACMLGLRPETVSFTDPAAPGAIPVTVEAETPLNEKTVTLVISLRGREILLSRPAGTPGPKSGTAAIAIDVASMFLFDKASGARISENGLTHEGKAA